jgi:ATP/maltotriose-dependent transcriptional regulator MalT
VTTFGVGRYDEGLAFAEQAVVEGGSAFGIDNVRTLDYRRWRVGMELELERHTDAARHLDELERTYRREPKTAAEQQLVLDGYFRARLALGRGKPQEAEKRVRDALASMGELRGHDVERVGMLQTLGESLVAQRRFAAARTALDEALALAPKLSGDDAPRAVIDVSYAEAELGLGKRAESLARARHAADVLSRFPGEVIARKRVAALLATLARK